MTDNSLRTVIARAIHDGPNAQSQYAQVGIQPHTSEVCQFFGQYLADADAVLAALADLPESVIEQHMLRNATERLQAAESRLDKIRARHLRVGTKAQSVCVHCDTAWPCETIKILDGEADDH